MTARDKLAEASFFLQKLQITSTHDANRLWDSGISAEYRYYVSACVWALYGSRDHLLYDYARKYWPNLGTDDLLDQKTVNLIAKATNNDEAKQFLEWYASVQGRIDKNRDAKTVLDVRRVEAHRGTTSYIYYPFAYSDTPTLHDVVTASGAITIGTFDPEPMPAQTQILPVSVVKTIVHFLTYPDKPVEKVIEATLNLLNEIITEAENKFGIPPSKSR